MKIYDVSRRIDEETPVWAGDVAFSWREISSPGAGTGWGSTCFSMSAHGGTHGIMKERHYTCILKYLDGLFSSATR